MRRTFTAIVAAVIVAGVVLAGPSAAAAAADDPVLADVEVTRYAGADRYETSLLVAGPSLTTRAAVSTRWCWCQAATGLTRWSQLRWRAT